MNKRIRKKKENQRIHFKIKRDGTSKAISRLKFHDFMKLINSKSYRMEVLDGRPY